MSNDDERCGGLLFSKGQDGLRRRPCWGIGHKPPILQELAADRGLDHQRRLLRAQVRTVPDRRWSDVSPSKPARHTTDPCAPRRGKRPPGIMGGFGLSLAVADEKEVHDPPNVASMPRLRQSRCVIDAFDLFCAYHLGLDRRGRRRFQNLHDVARDFGVGPEVIERALVEHGLDAARMMDRDFDLAAAQLDIQASPPGVDLITLAQMHWDLLCQAPLRPRDWAAEAEQDAAENERIFGPSKKRT